MSPEATAEVSQRFPVPATLPAAALVEDVAAASARYRLGFGDERVLAFLDALGRRMLRRDVVAAHPELGALGFFLRRGTLGREVARVRASAGHLRVPRGVVLHVPPGNVAPLLGYSWALSAAAGNANVVRLSQRPSAVAERIVELAREVLPDADEAVGRTQRLVAYGRDPAVTAALSDGCQVRVLWGGDRTVTTLRAVPLPPGATELTFPDRSSFAVVSAAGWWAATGAEREAAAAALFRDVSWYGQAACSSPRSVVWVGPAALADPARDDLVTRLEAQWAAAPERDAADAVQQRVAAYGLALRGEVERIRFSGTGLATLALAPERALPRAWAGPGTLALGRADDLAGVAALVGRHHQTVTQFGFTPAELRAFVEGLQGRGVDRVVPFGAALRFEAIWDGFDLLHELSRAVTVG